MGVPSVVPDMDVTAPGTLRAVALADAAEAIGASLVFASPAALANVIATAGELTPRHREALARVRLLLSAGAPVPSSMLRAAAELMPNAVAHTPYGMTEVLPVTDITPAGIEAAGAGNGVCVGPPIAEVSGRDQSARRLRERHRRVDHRSRRSSVRCASGPRTRRTATTSSG